MYSRELSSRVAGVCAREKKETRQNRSNCRLLKMTLLRIPMVQLPFKFKPCFTEQFTNTAKGLEHLSFSKERQLWDSLR